MPLGRALENQLYSSSANVALLASSPCPTPMVNSCFVAAPTRAIHRGIGRGAAPIHRDIGRSAAPIHRDIGRSTAPIQPQYTTLASPSQTIGLLPITSSPSSLSEPHLPLELPRPHPSTRYSAVPQHTLDEREHQRRVDLDMALEMVVRL